MHQLDIPDMCAHLDRMKRLCDRLEKTQADEKRYRQLALQIRAEADALRAIIYRPLSSSADDVRV